MKSFYWEASKEDDGLGIRFEDSYPVQDDIREGESGQGYVLRMARANFLTGLVEVRRRLGKNFSTTLTVEDAAILSKWFGCQLEELKPMLEKSVKAETDGLFDDMDASHYAGQHVPKLNYLNRIWPRVCPECLAENGHCRATWDFSFITACPKHECLLVDQCAACMKGISWQRPAVDICICGTYLNDTALYPRQQASNLDLEVAHWMSQWIDGASIQKTSIGSELPLLELIRPLSFQGGMNILWVLSLAEETKTLKNSSVIDGQMLERCRKTLLKANEFSSKLAVNDLEKFRSKKRQTLIPTLALCMNESYTYEDRSLAQSLISTILRASGKQSKPIGGVPVQQSLFAE